MGDLLKHSVEILLAVPRNIDPRGRRSARVVEDIDVLLRRPSAERVRVGVIEQDGTRADSDWASTGFCTKGSNANP